MMISRYTMTSLLTNIWTNDSEINPSLAEVQVPIFIDRAPTFFGHGGGGGGGNSPYISKFLESTLKMYISSKKREEMQFIYLFDESR